MRNDVRIFNTIISMRRIKAYEQGVAYVVLNPSSFSTWYFDSTDTTSVDNATSIIVNTSGQRLKKLTTPQEPSAFYGSLFSPYVIDRFAATAAYSASRKLSGAYTGAAFRVRRSSDNAELDIGFVGDNVDTASLLTFIGANNGVVNRFYDQSGNGRHFVQNDGGFQPAVVNAGTLIQNGSKPAISFNGTSSFMAVTGGFSLANYSIFATVAGVDTNTSNTVFSVGNFVGASGRDVNLVIDTGANTLINERTQGGSQIQATRAITPANHNIIYGLYNSTNLTANVNGVSGTPVACTSGIAGAPSTLIGAIEASASRFNYLKGKIGELIVFDSDKSAIAADIITNINSHFSIY